MNDCYVLYCCGLLAPHFGPQTCERDTREPENEGVREREAYLATQDVYSTERVIHTTCGETHTHDVCSRERERDTTCVAPTIISTPHKVSVRGRQERTARDSQESESGRYSLSSLYTHTRTSVHTNFHSCALLRLLYT